MQTLRFLVLAPALALAAAACGPGHDAPSSAATTAPAADAADPWFDGSYQDALAQARATKQLVFVDFWTKSCGWCKKLDKETFSQPAVRAELARMVSLSVDAESASGEPVRAKFHVTGFPTLLVVDGNGKEVGRIAGFLEPDPFLKKLAEIRARVAR